MENSIILQEMEKEWGVAVPVELRRLIRFQEEESEFENYSQGFGIWEGDFYEGLKAGWSADPNFLGKLYPFAQANGSGSTYAIWDDGEGYPMGDMPVVVFGDEGGEWVVADSFSEFLQLLTYDEEISAGYDYCFFYKDEEDSYENPDAEKFREWFKEYYDYLPIVESNEQAEQIIANAQEKNQAKFSQWLSEFGIEASEIPFIAEEETTDPYDNDNETEGAVEIITQMEKEWGRPVPVEIKRLIHFQQEESEFENYSQGFGVWAGEFYEGLEAGWSADPNFLGKLYPFAQANGSGSTYAIWDDGEGYPMGDMPVVVFGDEGGEWVVADHFGKFLQLLTFDTEIYVDYNSCFFYKDEEDHYENPDAEKFREWFKEYYDYLPIVESNEEAEQIIANAQEKNQEKFSAWLSQFEIGGEENSTEETEEAPDYFNLDGDKYEKAYNEDEYTDGSDDYEGDYSEVEAEFELIEFRPRLKEPYQIEQFEKLWVDLHFKTNVPCQVWVTHPEGLGGVYASSNIYEVGESKTDKYLSFNQVPDEEKINHLVLAVAFVNGQYLDMEVPFDCKIVRPTHTEVVNDGEGTTDLSGEVTLVVNGNTYRLNEAHKIPVGVDVEVNIPYKTGAKYGINIWAHPVKGTEECGSEYPIGFNGSEDYFGKRGVAEATFAVEAPCKPEYLRVFSQNKIAGVPIFSKDIPMNIEFVEMNDDGVGTSRVEGASIYIAGEDNCLEDKATINTETELEIHYGYKNTTQHGIYFKLYSVVGDEVQEQILQSNTLTDPNRTSGYIKFYIDEAQEIDDFLWVMYNSAGEVLDKMVLELSLSVEDYDRPRKRAERPEETPKKGGFLGGLGKMLGLD